jgi:uncharacterized OB-fold protein
VSRPLPAEVVCELRALGSATAHHLVPIDPHLAAGSGGRIALPWCHRCRSAHWYPALRCPGCGAADWAWRDLGTEAVLDSWTRVHHPLAPALRPQVPFVVGLAVPVRAPHVRLVAVLVTRAGETPQIGQRLSARPGPPLDGGNLLIFATEAAP